MKDLSKAPGIGGALKKDKQLKKWSGKVISLPGSRQKPVKIDIFKSWKTIKGLKGLIEAGEGASGDIQVRMATTSDPDELQLLQAQLNTTQQAMQQAKKALQFMKSSKNKRRNAFLLAGIKLTGAGAAITKIPFVDRFILNYGHVFVYLMIGSTLFTLIFVLFLFSQVTSGNVIVPLQTGADIATGKCEVSDISCIGPSLIQHSGRNGNTF